MSWELHPIHTFNSWLLEARSLLTVLFLAAFLQAVSIPKGLGDGTCPHGRGRTCSTTLSSAARCSQAGTRSGGRSDHSYTWRHLIRMSSASGYLWVGETTPKLLQVGAHGSGPCLGTEISVVNIFCSDGSTLGRWRIQPSRQTALPGSRW